MSLVIVRVLGLSKDDNSVSLIFANLEVAARDVLGTVLITLRFRGQAPRRRCCRRRAPWDRVVGDPKVTEDLAEVGDLGRGGQ
eukprot:scaffold2557_cov135-Isochrysis_galbana.AAC.2